MQHQRLVRDRSAGRGALRAPYSLRRAPAEPTRATTSWAAMASTARDDGGESWTRVGPRRTAGTSARSSCDPRNADRVLVAALRPRVRLRRRARRVPDARRRAQLAVRAAGAGFGGRGRPGVGPASPGGGVRLDLAAAAPPVARLLHAAGRAAARASGAATMAASTGARPRGRAAGRAHRGRIGLAVARGSGGRVRLRLPQAFAGTDTSATPAPEPASIAATDGGATWQLVERRTPPSASSYFGRLVVSPADSSTRLSRWGARSGSRATEAAASRCGAAPGGDDYHALWVDATDERRMIARLRPGAAVSLERRRAPGRAGTTSPPASSTTSPQTNSSRITSSAASGTTAPVEIASRGPYGVIEEARLASRWRRRRARLHGAQASGPAHRASAAASAGTVSRFDEADATERRRLGLAARQLRRGPDHRALPLTRGSRRSVISPLAPHAMYLGAQVLFRSRDDGQSWDVVSPDLSGKTRRSRRRATIPRRSRRERAATASSSASRPRRATLDRAVVGTDDGLVKRTADGGAPLAGRHARRTSRRGDRRARSTSRRWIPPPPTSRSTPTGWTVSRPWPSAPLTDGAQRWRPDHARDPGRRVRGRGALRPQAARPAHAGTDRSVYVRPFDDGDELGEPLAAGLPTSMDARPARAITTTLIVSQPGDAASGCWTI